MHIERSVQPVQSLQLKTENAPFNQKRETFQDFFERSLASESKSRPSKIEITGILVPVNKIIGRCVFKFKLDAGTETYLLRMTHALENVVRKIEWEQVSVRGYLDIDSNVLEVEKVTLVQNGDPLRPHAVQEDFFFETDSYRRTIAQRGKLEPSNDFLAS
ncbi:MAG: hypothetical protein K2X47_06230 [Bdellovibrionales bacterium]|nr:hypothetical protein [Bdellovibrionales bacterium]